MSTLTISPCLKRRMFYAASQTYHPDMETIGRTVGWLSRPIAVRREVEGREIDFALVGRVREGVVVAFRGALPPFFGGRHDGWAVLLDWLNDGLSVCVNDPDYPGGVHLGFAASVRRLWEDKDDMMGLRCAVDRMLAEGAPRHLFVAGHSKGGALANLFAWRANELGKWADMPISVATIAAARAGNGGFAAAYDASRIDCIRYEVDGDLMPHLPFNPDTPRWVREITRHYFLRIAESDYQPVGVRVSHAPVGGGRVPLRRNAGRGANTRRPAFLPRFRRPDLGLVTPRLVAAHAICPQSDYDTLICTGEDACDHGVAHKPSVLR